ncbi:UvrD-helicase domain-containing protein [Anaerococcus martiniensis]|uniref:UvrD-helicase domain-containing protein n=1 Tax=Anaerococcus sp. WGS1579 TaxID=3366809 RepID=UPI00372D5D91
MMHSTKQPTEHQKDIINAPGNLVVSASAGTGKTYTMVEKIFKDINDNTTHKSVAAITFTIKAAKEIKERLTIDTSSHFIGTNNSFVIEEVIKPFAKDIYGNEFDKDMDTDYYSADVKDFDSGVFKLKEESLLGSYGNNAGNFIFELALHIVKNSNACQLYLKAKYFKLYIDEYQDCDGDMHTFFMYLCDKLEIETFIVGDDKQSIYIWRGAHPEAFKSIFTKNNFTKKVLYENFRSCKQIQNYTNLLFAQTGCYYDPLESNESINLVIATEEDWFIKVSKIIKKELPFALLRFRNDNAEKGAEQLRESGLDCIFVPKTPISNISTETTWMYTSIAKYLILEKYSVYDFISDIPAEGTNNTKVVNNLKNHLKVVEKSKDFYEDFVSSVISLAEYLGYKTKIDHIKKLYDTVMDDRYHNALIDLQNRNVAFTFHSSKGLEFEQVIIFSSDYTLSNQESLYNHYVASSRAISKLIIVHFSGNCYSNAFIKNLHKIMNDRGVNINSLIRVIS